MQAVALVVMPLAAAACAALAMPGPARSPERVRSDLSPRRGGRWTNLVGVLGVLVGLGVVVGARWLPVLVGLASVVATVGLLLGRARSQRRMRATADEVARACQVLAGQLRIGQIPVVALRTAAEDSPVLERAVATHQVGGEVPAALRRVAEQPGADGLRALAAAWQLAERSGAPLAEAAERVTRRLAEQGDLRRAVAAELAPARATGKLLAGLPVVGLAMGFMVGGSPDEFLLQTWLGRWLLAAALVLACVGVLWTELLADRVERRTR